MRDKQPRSGKTGSTLNALIASAVGMRPSPTEMVHTACLRLLMHDFGNFGVLQLVN